MCDEYEPPDAESARLPLLGRALGGWLLVLCVLEAGRLAHMRMVVDVAEPDIVREVLGISLGVSFKLIRRGNSAISFAKTDHFAISICHIRNRWIDPTSVAVTTVL